MHVFSTSVQVYNIIIAAVDSLDAYTPVIEHIDLSDCRVLIGILTLASSRSLSYFYYVRESNRLFFKSA